MLTSQKASGLGSLPSCQEAFVVASAEESSTKALRIDEQLTNQSVAMEAVQLMVPLPRVAQAAVNALGTALCAGFCVHATEPYQHRTFESGSLVLTRSLWLATRARNTGSHVNYLVPTVGQRNRRMPCCSL